MNKMGEELKAAYEEFLEREEYDKAQDAMHGLVKLAFEEGWKAAGVTVVDLFTKTDAQNSDTQE